MRLVPLLLLACNQDTSFKETSRCDGKLQSDETTVDAPYDEDADGFVDGGNLDCVEAYSAEALDCDDDDASVYPGAVELSCSGVDEDCDAETPDAADADADGVTACTDCDDTDPRVSPDAPEVCNHADDDCDTEIDEGLTRTWYADADQDGAGDPASPFEDCETPADGVANADDCDDADATAWPGNEEVCDGVDNDCDGEVDENVGGLWYEDLDADGYGDDTSAIVACDAPFGRVDIGGDCDDTRDSIHPGADERCNGIDDDCNGLTDEDSAIDALTWYVDADGDSYGIESVVLVACDDPGEAWVVEAGDCDDGDAAVYPGAAELCNLLDDDCDGLIDADDPSVTGGGAWYADTDSDGYGDPASLVEGCSAPGGYVANAADCDDRSATISPAATEVCDGVDNDCDLLIDGDDPGSTGGGTWYPDNDLDGYGDPAGALSACDMPAGYIVTSGDCDDVDATISPAATERCNGYDDDCDGLVDDADSGVADTSPWYADIDGDGYGDSGSVYWACSAPLGTSADNTDCMPVDGSIHPNAPELCDRVDQDCDGLADDGLLGSGASCPAEDCLEILLDQPGAPSGNWYLDRGVYYCDMVTDGGGWTQVANAVAVWGTGYDTTAYNYEGFTWDETLFAYDSGTVHAHCDYPGGLTGCNNLGFQFATESWGIAQNWGASLCGLVTSDYTGATVYPGGYDFIIQRGTSTDTIKVGTLEGIAACTTSDNPGTAWVDIRVR